MKITFVNKAKGFKIRFRYNFEISNNFVVKVNLRILLIIKRVINLSVDVNEEVAISSLSVLNNRFIISFKSNALKAAAFNEVLLKIKIKLNKLLIFSSTIITCFF